MYINICVFLFLDWVRDVAWAPNTAMPYNMISIYVYIKSTLYMHIY
jgi:hypothetical protein